ncbi:MAG: hypothetical protein ACFFCW_17000 [Candidatus Hodarchaeota archaeon]
MTGKKSEGEERKFNHRMERTSARCGQLTGGAVANVWVVSPASCSSQGRADDAHSDVKPMNSSMKKIAFICLCLFFVSSGQASEKNNVEELKGSINYLVPDSWQIQEKNEASNFFAIQFFIPLVEIIDTPQSANAVIVVEENKENISLEQYSNWKLSNDYEGNFIVGDKTDGDIWRSVLWRSQEKDSISYVIFDRFGVTPEIRVHFRIAFPLLGKMSQEWIENICNEINSVILNLKIKKNNVVESKIIFQNGIIGLKDLTISSMPKYGINTK